MAIVVDTCSLVMIAKNYLPLDKDGQLYSFLEEAFSRKDLMLLDVILDESKRTSWKSHSTLTLLATQDLPTFLYYMIDPLKSWCWGAILFYPFKNSRFS